MATAHTEDVPLPPFERDVELFDWPANHDHPNSTSKHQTGTSRPKCVIPGVCQTREWGVFSLFRVENDLNGFIKQDVSIQRLNEVADHLLISGSFIHAPPLHVHTNIDHKTIAIVENIDNHLLFDKSHIYIKPLPGYLTCFDIWQHIICPDSSLYPDALGLLTTYLWLISHESDLRIAHENGLISRHVSWIDWTRFSASIGRHVDPYNKKASQRYEYGVINKKTLEFLADPYRKATLVRAFFTKNPAWIGAATVYVVLALTAMQVGLAMTKLSTSTAFQNASYGFAVFSIVTPLILLGADGISFVWTACRTGFFIFVWREMQKLLHSRTTQSSTEAESANNDV